MKTQKLNKSFKKIAIAIIKIIPKINNYQFKIFLIKKF